MHLNDHCFQDISQMALDLTSIHTLSTNQRAQTVTISLKVKGQGHNASAINHLRIVGFRSIYQLSNMLAFGFDMFTYILC